MIFEVSDAWRSAFPEAAVGVLALGEVTNPSGHPGLEAARAELEAGLRQRFAGQGRSDLTALPVLQAYAAHYKRFDKTYHVLLQLESIAFKGKSIPGGAGLVEAMFMAELKNMLLTAGHDLDEVRQPVRLEVSKGDESYVLLRGEKQILKPGDMFIADRDGVISDVLYGPDERTRIRPETRSVLYTVYAPAGIGAGAVKAHLQDIENTVRIFAPQARTELAQVYEAAR